MNNYVCQIIDADKNKVVALKVGQTNDCKKRFMQIAREAEKQHSTLKNAMVKPLFIFEIEDNKTYSKIFEDELRLYYLKKLGLNRGIKRDYISIKGLPLDYDIEQESKDMENKCAEFEYFNVRITYNSNDYKNQNNHLIFFSNFRKQMQYFCKDI